MRPRTTLQTWILCVSAFLYAATTYACRRPEPRRPRRSSGIAGRSLRTRQGRLPSDHETDVAQAKTVLVEALGRLDEKLTEAGANGEGWRKYLHWDAAARVASRREEAQFGPPDQNSRPFTRGYDGLELAWFLDVQHALQNYIVTASVVGSPQVRTDYESELDKLAPDPEGVRRQADDRGRPGHQRVGPLAAKRPPGAGAGRRRFKIALSIRT